MDNESEIKITEYVPTNWVNDKTPLNAANLNHIEQALEALLSANGYVASLQGQLTTLTAKCTEADDKADGINNSLIMHSGNKENPHEVSADQINGIDEYIQAKIPDVDSQLNTLQEELDTLKTSIPSTDKILEAVMTEVQDEFVSKDEADIYATKEDLANVTVDLSAYYTKEDINSEFYNKGWIDEQLSDLTTQMSSLSEQVAKLESLLIEPILSTCLAFTSDTQFTLTANGGSGGVTWDGELEYSTDCIDWETWNGSAITSAKIYIRGKGNTYITDGRIPYWTFGGAVAEVECKGNIENLLDYETVARGDHPQMAEYCFKKLFMNTNKLVTPPELPALELTTGCYSQMFYNCKSLKSAPKLDAKELKQSCYATMFYGCTSLVTAPALPASNIPANAYDAMFTSCTALTTMPNLEHIVPEGNRCCNSMFKGCSNLVVSIEQTDTETVPFIIAKDVETITVTDPFKSMFGDLTPVANTTYYTTNTPVK